MNIADTLRFFRTKKQVTQKEMLLDHISPSSYSRIEGNRRSIKLDDLQSILQNLSIHPDEFFSFAALDEEQNWYRETYYYCAKHPENQSKKKKLLTYYYNLKNNKNKDLRELSNYIAIKCLFQLFWSEIEIPTTEEITTIYKMLISKSYYLQYDYILISNLITYFNTKEADIIMLRAFPVKDEEKRDYTTKKFSYNTWINLISLRLHEENYEKVNKYLKLAFEQDKEKNNYSFLMQLRYLENLSNYLQTGDPKYMDKVNNFIRTLEDIGDLSFAEAVTNEVKMLTIKSSGRDSEKSKYAVTPIKLD